MKKDRNGEKRPLSAGTTIMLVLLVIVLAVTIIQFSSEKKFAND